MDPTTEWTVTVSTSKEYERKGLQTDVASHFNLAHWAWNLNMDWVGKNFVYTR